MRIQRHILQQTAIHQPRTFTSKLHAARIQARALSTLPSNLHIYIHPSLSSSPSSLSHGQGTYTLSFSPNPPSPSTAIGHSSTNPPTPGTFHSNPHFTRILHETLAAHAHADPSIKAAAVRFAATNVGPGAGLGVGVVTPSRTQRLRNKQKNESAQESEDSTEHVGFMHVADERNPAVYGRIPEPEDIFGTLQVGPNGRFVDGTGVYQESGTYRVLTREGCLGLSDFLRQRLIERLAEEEQKESGNK